MVLLILIVGLSSYGFGLVLAALVLRAPALRNLVANVAYLGLALVVGVQVPVCFWPAPVETLSALLPVTHGLQAVRAALSDEPLGVVAWQGVLELAVGIAWMALAALLFHAYAEAGRRDGSLEFGD